MTFPAERTPGRLAAQAIESAPFGENTYIAHLDGRTECLVIDPGFEPDKIAAAIERDGLRPVAILITHGHCDHIGGVEHLKQHWPTLPVVIGRGDAPKLIDAELNLSAGYGFDVVSPPADVLLDEGDRYEAAGIELYVLEIPGHSSGHVVYVWRGGSRQIVFGGDVLFAGSIGRTDFPDGSFEQLAQGIRAKLFTLPEDTIVLPGHGPTTTVGEERRTNPFVGDSA